MVFSLRASVADDNRRFKLGHCVPSRPRGFKNSCLRRCPLPDSVKPNTTLPRPAPTQPSGIPAIVQSRLSHLLARTQKAKLMWVVFCSVKAVFQERCGTRSHTTLVSARYITVSGRCSLLNTNAVVNHRFTAAALPLQRRSPAFISCRLFLRVVIPLTFIFLSLSSLSLHLLFLFLCVCMYWQFMEGFKRGCNDTVEV